MQWRHVEAMRYLVCIKFIAFIAKNANEGKRRTGEDWPRVSHIVDP